MEKYFDVLVRKNRELDLRLFYTCEPNIDRNGFHVHYVLGTNSDAATNFIDTTESHFHCKKKMNNLYIKPFQLNKKGIKYILKNMSDNGDGYEFLTHNT